MTPKKQAPKAAPKKQASVTKPTKKPVVNNTKQTSDNIASISAKGLKKPESLTPTEIKKICASNIAQSNPRDGK